MKETGGHVRANNTDSLQLDQIETPDARECGRARLSGRDLMSDISSCDDEDLFSTEISVCLVLMGVHCLSINY